MRWMLKCYSLTPLCVLTSQARHFQGPGASWEFLIVEDCFMTFIHPSRLSDELNGATEDRAPVGANSQMFTLSFRLKENRARVCLTAT